MIRKRLITTTLPPLQAPTALGVYLRDRFTYLNQNQWDQEISSGKVYVNGDVETDPAAMLCGGETLTYDGSNIIEPEVDDRIAVLYQDDILIAVNKTGNLPVHPSGRYFNHTLTAILEDRLGQRVYPVHRIDRETSGVILLAFNSSQIDALASALARGTKEYLALVHGIFPEEEIVIDLPLGRDPESPIGKKRKAWPGGTETAVTRFRKVLTDGDISLIRCFPETGRLHQIRAHLQAVGFPIIGDKLYGREPDAFLEFIQNGLTDALLTRLILPRSALHAAGLVFNHPVMKKEIKIYAPLPKMFGDFIKARTSGKPIKP